MFIPDPDPQNIAGEIPPRAGRAALRGRVLLIEDDWLIASLVSGELAEYGYEVVALARSVAQASSLAETAVIDAALVDLNSANRVHNARLSIKPCSGRRRN